MKPSTWRDLGATAGPEVRDPFAVEPEEGFQRAEDSSIVWSDARTPANEDCGHDEDERQQCIEENHTVTRTCRGGECCRLLVLVEATLQDAVREPKIREGRLPTLSDLPDPTTGRREFVGYYLSQKFDDLRSAEFP